MRYFIRTVFKRRYDFCVKLWRVTISWWFLRALWNLVPGRACYYRGRLAGRIVVILIAFETTYFYQTELCSLWREPCYAYVFMSLNAHVLVHIVLFCRNTSKGSRMQFCTIWRNFKTSIRTSGNQTFVSFPQTNLSSPNDLEKRGEERFLFEWCPWVITTLHSASFFSCLPKK